jgi:CBS domain-containing protein
MNIREIIEKKSTGVTTIEPDKTVYEAVRLLVDKNIGSLVVAEGGTKVVGIITERDILKECARRYEKLAETRIRDVMTTNVIVVKLEDDIRFAERVMTEKHIRHLPVLEDGNLAGMLSIGDIVKTLHAQTAAEANDLRDMLAGHYVVA